MTRLEYVARQEALYLYASNRGALLSACLEHAALIVKRIPDAERERPCWFLVLPSDSARNGDGAVLIMTHVIAEAPDWWRDLARFRGDQIPMRRDT